jgi:hypothetical protein
MSITVTWYVYSVFISTFFTIIFFFSTVFIYILRQILQLIFERKRTDFFKKLRDKDFFQRTVIKIKSFKWWFSIFLDIIYFFEGCSLLLLVFSINSFLLFALFLNLYGTSIAMALVTLISIVITFVHTCRERNYHHVLVHHEVNVNDVADTQGKI